MKKNTLFMVMLASLLGFAFSAEKGALSLITPSAMASSDKDSKNKDAKDQDSAKDSSNEEDGGSASTCTCPPGITSCICPDGSTGAPGAGSLSIVPGSLRSVHGN